MAGDNTLRDESHNRPIRTFAAKPVQPLFAPQRPNPCTTDSMSMLRAKAKTAVSSHTGYLALAGAVRPDVLALKFPTASAQSDVRPRSIV